MPHADPLREILALELAALRKWASPSTLRAASEVAGEATVDRVGDTLLLNLPGTPEVGAGSGAGFLHQMALLLEEATRSALAIAPQVIGEQMFALSVSSRADRMPRLAAMLRRIAKLMELVRLHTIGGDRTELLIAIAEAYALVTALTATPDNLALRGVLRRDCESVGALDLISFGAQRWKTDAGAAGLTA